MLGLSTEAVIFEPNSTSDIFYDDINQKICTVRGNGEIGVKARGPSPRDIISFRLKDKGLIRLIKLAPGYGLVCVQREISRVDLAVLKTSSTDFLCEFGQNCKMRNASILDLFWTGPFEVLIVTDQGLELYSINAEKNAIKFIKSFNISTLWSIFYPNCNLLLTASGHSGTILNPFLIQSGSINRLRKFEIDLGCSTMKLLKRDVTISSIYGLVYAIILRHNPAEENHSDVLLYEFSNAPLQSAHLTHLLVLNESGKMAVHILDNLVIVHHQNSSKSMLFDLKTDRTFDKSFLRKHRPLINECKICIPETISMDPQCRYSDSVQLYAPTWVILPPDIIIDPKNGFMWRLRLRLEPTIISAIDDKCVLVRFLLNRRAAKRLLLNVIRSLLQMRTVSLTDCGLIFDWLAEAYDEHIRKTQLKAEQSAKNTFQVEYFHPVIVEQQDVYSTVFHSLTEDRQQTGNLPFLIDCMLQYLLSLQEHHIESQLYLHEIIISSLLRCRNFAKLEQLLQYRVISDAKPLAFLLLSFESKHRPLFQLALDMLSRLGTSNEEVLQVLLSKNRVIEAMRFLESSGHIDRINPIKFVESAWKCERATKFAVFNHFQNRALKMKGQSNFAIGEQFEQYLDEFKQLYSQEEMINARSDSDFVFLL